MFRLLLVLSLAASGFSQKFNFLEGFLKEEQRTEALIAAEAAKAAKKSPCSPVQAKVNCTGECNWCSLGKEGGICLDQTYSDKVNNAQIPHLNCMEESPSDIFDQFFWEDTISCFFNSTKGECMTTHTISGKGCSWCNVRASGSTLSYNETDISMDLRGMPQFGVCLSNDFVEEMDEHIAKTPNVKQAGNAVTCSNIESDLDAPSIVDFKCSLMSVFKKPDLCNKFKDIEGNDCIWTNVFGYTDLCLSRAQSSIILVLEKVSTGLGLDIITEKTELN